MIRQARGYFGIDAKAYGHVGHVDLSALKVCIQYTAGAAFCLPHPAAHAYTFLPTWERGRLAAAR